MFGKRKETIVDACGYTNPGGRKENEDFCKKISCKRGGDCFLLADGLGGHGGGERASRMAVETVAKEFLRGKHMQPKEFDDWFQKANQEVFAMQTGECAMKTTLVALQLEDNHALWAHVGDSRLYHFVDGRLVERTLDHSVSQMAVLCGEIEESEIRGHVDRNRLLRALGRDETIRIDVSDKVELTKGEHAFLLCTDGFWEYVYEEEMEVALQNAKNAKQWLHNMILCLKNRAQDGNDNNTAITVILRK